jgi:heat shock protein HslJ
MKKSSVFYAWAALFVTWLAFCTVGEAGGNIPAAAGMEDTKWLLSELSGAPVSPMAGEKRPHILIDSELKKASGFAGCNNFFAGYEINGAALKFGPAGSTRMACPDLETGLETEFLKALDKTVGWEIRDNVLLFLDNANVLARFTKEDIIEEITGTVWQWVQTQYNDDKKTVPSDPKDYTVQFQGNGNLSVKADCNQKSGTYSAEEKHLSIEITHSTMASCQEGSLEDEFVRGLSTAAIYFIKDGDLYIDLEYDTGTMRFSKQKE